MGFLLFAHTICSIQEEIGTYQALNIFQACPAYFNSMNLFNPHTLLWSKYYVFLLIISKSRWCGSKDHTLDCYILQPHPVTVISFNQFMLSLESFCFWKKTTANYVCRLNIFRAIANNLNTCQNLKNLLWLPTLYFPTEFLLFSSFLLSELYWHPTEVAQNINVLVLLINSKKAS